jgi:hypothetical protein
MHTIVVEMIIKSNIDIFRYSCVLRLIDAAKGGVWPLSTLDVLGADCFLICSHI